MAKFDYLILGAGRQGTAAAYDLAKFGNARRIVITDKSINQAERAAARVNQLAKSNVAIPTEIDVSDISSVKALMGNFDSILSAVPYKYNLSLTEAACAAGSHWCDMGGFTEIVRNQLTLDQEAKKAGISIVPDCGMGPGLINTMGAYAIDFFEIPKEIYIYDAGLPQIPVPPWNYQLTFHINGLTNEMDGKAIFIRDGKIAYVDTLTEPELIDFPPFGILEADVTSGGTSTAPWSFLDRVQRYENKVLRYPGHYEWLRGFKTLGLFSQEPIQINGEEIVPRDVYHSLLEPKISGENIRDIGIIRVKGIGVRGGKHCRITIDLIDRYDDDTGFTAMERLTGWHCSIIMIFQTQGVILPGAWPLELAVPAEKVMEALELRGIPHTVSIEKSKTDSATPSQ
jgi:lysine 6-dehydrogenase